MAPNPKLTNEEKKWRAQDDARQMAHVDEIVSDPKRLAAAQAEAATMAEDAVKTANRFVKVAKLNGSGGSSGGGGGSTSVKKTTAKATPKAAAPKTAAAKTAKANSTAKKPMTANKTAKTKNTPKSKK